MAQLLRRLHRGRQPTHAPARLLLSFALGLALLLVVPAARAEAAGNVTVTPSRGLVDGRPVTVSGGGFTPNVDLVVNQCAAEATSSAGCSAMPQLLTGNAGGTYSTTFAVQRNLVTNGIGTIDCGIATHRCGIVVIEYNNVPTAVAVGLGFGRISASPARGLAEHHTIDVAGGGFTPNTSLVVTQCAAEATSAAGCDTTPLLLAGTSTGTYSTSYTVHRNLVTNGIGTIDCGASPSRCGVVVLEHENVATAAPHGLWFATATASPSSGLMDGQMITLAGGGFPAATVLEARECVIGASPPVCSDTVSTPSTNEIGNYSAPVIVNRAWSHPTQGWVTCSSSPCAIEVNVTANPALRTSTPISFFAGQISVSPTTVSDGQVIGVTGTGWGAGAVVEVGQCAFDLYASGTPCASTAFLTADQNGNFFIQGYVYRYPVLQNGQQPDCRAWDQRCSMAARSAGDSGTDTLTYQSLTFT